MNVFGHWVTSQKQDNESNEKADALHVAVLEVSEVSLKKQRNFHSDNQLWIEPIVPNIFAISTVLEYRTCLVSNMLQIASLGSRKNHSVIDPTSGGTIRKHLCTISGERWWKRVWHIYIPNRTKCIISLACCIFGPHVRPERWSRWAKNWLQSPQISLGNLLNSLEIAVIPAIFTATLTAESCPKYAIFCTVA